MGVPEWRGSRNRDKYSNIDKDDGYPLQDLNATKASTELSSAQGTTTEVEGRTANGALFQHGNVDPQSMYVEREISIQRLPPTMNPNTATFLDAQSSSILLDLDMTAFMRQP